MSYDDFAELQDDRQFQKDLLLNDEYNKQIPSEYSTYPIRPTSTYTPNSYTGAKSNMALPSLISGIASAGSSMWGNIIGAGSNYLTAKQAADASRANTELTANSNLTNFRESRELQKLMWEREWETARKMGLSHPSQISQIGGQQGQLIGRQIGYGPRVPPNSVYR